MTHNLPPNASVTTPNEGVKLHAPSAERNAGAITEMLVQHAPARGQALEIASGTGQHIVTFAAVLPHVDWQPTEIDSARRASIDAYVHEAGLQNIAPTQDLNATQTGWGAAQGPYDLICLSNLLHLISTPETETLIEEAAQALHPTGKLILYGPFARDGQLTSEGDQRFDAQLRGADPAIGYKDTRDMAQWLQRAGLGALILQDMPANNLAVIATREPT